MNLLRMGAAAALVMQTACSGPAHTNQPARPVPITVAPVRRMSLSGSTELSGTIQAVNAATVGAMTAGRVIAVNVRVGDRVSAGDTIAQIDQAQYRSQFSQAQAAAQSATQDAQAAQAQADAARSRLALTRITAGRMSLLYREGAISAQQHDQTQADVETAAAAVQQSEAAAAAARSAAAQAHAGITTASVPLAQSTITAPFSGVITQKFIAPGAVVAPGSPIVALQGTRDLELDVAVPDQQAALLNPGKRVTVHVDALTNVPVPAYVRAIVPSENTALRSVTVKIDVVPRPGLIAGMFARVSIPGARKTAWSVPLQAVASRAGQTGVFTVHGGIATFVPVSTAGTDGNDVAVQGVAGSGVRVAISNVQRLTEGTRVRVER